jgi:type VI protein secretion system component Hcp
MATRTFLKMEGIPGDSKDRKYSGWIEVLWWVSTSNALSKEGLTPSKPDRTRIRFGIRKEGTASGKLYLASTGKLSIKGAATLVDVVDEDGGKERTRITMKDVAVVVYRPPEGNKGTEVIVILEYTPETPSGGSGGYPILRPGLRGFPTERFGPPGF